MWRMPSKERPVHPFSLNPVCACLQGVLQGFERQVRPLGNEFCGLRCPVLIRSFTLTASKRSVLLQVMIRLATTVDDTVMLSKTMIAEWIKDRYCFESSPCAFGALSQDMADLCFDKYAHKVLAWILQHLASLGM